MGSPRAQAALWAALLREAVSLTGKRDDDLDDLRSYYDERVKCEWVDQQPVPTFQLVVRSWTGALVDFVQFSLDAQGHVRVACSSQNVRLHDFVLDPASDEDAQLRATDLIQTAIRVLVPAPPAFDGASDE